MGRRPTGLARGGLARGGQKGGLKEAFGAEIAAEIEALVGEGAVEDWDFEAIEMAARREALRVAARAVEARLNADTSDHAGPGLAAAMVSFAEGSELMQELAGVPVDPKQVERTAEALGREIAQDERGVIEPEPPSAPTMYLGMDGTGVPMRASELEGREGKQPDGSSKTREVKLVVVWTAEGRDEEGIPERDPGSVTYSAAIESAASRDTDEAPSEFAQRVYREAQRRGFALWIWNLAAEQFPGAIQIVDLYHAKGHLTDVAKAIYGPVSDLGEQWAKQRRDELDEGKLDGVLQALHVHAEANNEARKCLDYVTRNRSRMRYPEFRALGLCVSSGVVEAGCKVAIGTRLKRAGMHWTVAGADAIIALRCCKLSGRFEDFWERRSAAAASGAG